jgi:tRNA (guanine37-N1)-methyltransferase
MVMKAPPLLAGIEAAGPGHRILLTPAGRPLAQARVRELAAVDHLVLVCGRYEGIDERVRELAIDEELSLGDFVLSGGEPAAMALIDAIARHVPGVLGDATSADDESFAAGLLEYPQYTRPPEVAGRAVPEILLSGDHARVRAWREAEALRRTRERRPDLLPARPPAVPTFSALVHHPVLDQGGDVITTAITNLDIHDIARASRTYGLAGYFVVTPIEAQRELAGRIIGHWTDGAGRAHNDKRTDALSLVRVVSSLEEAVAAVAAETGRKPRVVATSARSSENALKFNNFDRGSPTLLLFGTGWGLAPEALRSADAVLEPIHGAGEYNHLSVRSAVAIVLDRLFGASR